MQMLAGSAIRDATGSASNSSTFSASDAGSGAGAVKSNSANKPTFFLSCDGVADSGKGAPPSGDKGVVRCMSDPFQISCQTSLAAARLRDICARFPCRAVARDCRCDLAMPFCRTILAQTGPPLRLTQRVEVVFTSASRLFRVTAKRVRLAGQRQLAVQGMAQCRIAPDRESLGQRPGARRQILRPARIVERARQGSRCRMPFHLAHAQHEQCAVEAHAVIHRPVQFAGQPSCRTARHVHRGPARDMPRSLPVVRLPGRARDRCRDGRRPSR